MFRNLFRNKRLEILQSLAYSLRMEFKEKDDLGLINFLKDFKLFKKGHNKKIFHILKKNEQETDLKTFIFDYRYTISSGNSSHTYKQTVFFIRTKELGLPEFFLRPENFLHKIGSWLGIEDIDFESDPEFSKAYYLTGEESDIVKNTFTEDVRAYFRIQKKWHVEGLNYFLVVYRPNKLLPPEQIETFYKQAMRIYDLLRKEGFRI